MTSCALTFWLLLYPFPGCLMPDAAAGPPAGSGTPIAAYGRTDPTCAEWTDGCVVCIGTGGHPQCSTPGIACTPAGPTCTRREAP